MSVSKIRYVGLDVHKHYVMVGAERNLYPECRRRKRPFCISQETGRLAWANLIN